MDLPKLSQFTIERCLKPANFGNIVSSQLHHFSDASEIGFGSVLFLCLSDGNGGIHCTILQGKSHLVPLKQVMIPCLELSAAVVSVQLDKVLKRELDLPLTEKSVFWTDATSGTKPNDFTHLWPIVSQSFETVRIQISGSM